MERSIPLKQKEMAASEAYWAIKCTKGSLRIQKPRGGCAVTYKSQTRHPQCTKRRPDTHINTGDVSRVGDIEGERLQSKLSIQF